MRQTKVEKLTEVILVLFPLNGALIEWGDDFVAAQGLTSARWQMLGALALAERPLTAPQVAVRMGVTRQGAQKQLKLLVDAHLVEMQPNPLHKRSPLYALTERGRRIYGAIDARWKARAERLVASLSANDLDVTANVLTALVGMHARVEAQGL